MNPRKKNILGRKFHRLTVIEELPSVKIGNSHASRVRVRCDCGTEKVIWRYQIVANTTKSCGCLQREIIQRQNPDGLTERQLAARRQARKYARDQAPEPEADRSALALARMKW